MDNDKTIVMMTTVMMMLMMMMMMMMMLTMMMMMVMMMVMMMMMMIVMVVMFLYSCLVPVIVSSNNFSQYGSHESDFKADKNSAKSMILTIIVSCTIIGRINGENAEQYQRRRCFFEQC